MVVHFPSGGPVLPGDLCTTFLAPVSSCVDALARAYHTVARVWRDGLLVGTRTGETETGDFTQWGHRFSVPDAYSYQLASRSIIHLRRYSAVVDCAGKFLSLICIASFLSTRCVYWTQDDKSRAR